MLYLTDFKGGDSKRYSQPNIHVTYLSHINEQQRSMFRRRGRHANIRRDQPPPYLDMYHFKYLWVSLYLTVSSYHHRHGYHGHCFSQQVTPLPLVVAAAVVVVTVVMTVLVLVLTVMVIIAGAASATLCKSHRISHSQYHSD